MNIDKENKIVYINPICRNCWEKETETQIYYQAFTVSEK